jgi:hypothetical protein
MQRLIQVLIRLEDDDVATISRDLGSDVDVDHERIKEWAEAVLRERIEACHSLLEKETRWPS